MNALEQVTLAWNCLALAFRQLPRPALWAPWLALGAAQLLVVIALWGFAHPWLSWLMVPVIGSAVGARALHYPDIFRYLPGLFERADRVLSPTLGALAAGVGTVLFAGWFEGRGVRARAAALQGFRRALSLILVHLPLLLITFGLSHGVEAWLGHRGSSGITRRILETLVSGAVLLARCALLYVSALVMLENRNWLSALAALPRVAARGFVAALVLTVITGLIGLVLERLLAVGGGRFGGDVPEMAGMLISGEIAIRCLCAFLLTGSATLFFQTSLLERPQEVAT